MTRDADGWDETADRVRGSAPIGAGKRRAELLAEPRLSVAAGCVLLAVVVVVGGWSGLLLVVAGHVVPGWALSGALLVASLMPGLARRLLRRRTRAADHVGRGVRQPWVLTLLTAVAGVGAGVGSALGAMGDLGATYHVLAPNAPAAAGPPCGRAPSSSPAAATSTHATVAG